MDPAHRAGLGFGLVSVAYLGFVPFALADGGTVGPFAAGVVALGAGTLLAAAGAALGPTRGRAALAIGCLAAAAGAAVVLLADLGSAGLFIVPHAVAAIAYGQSAWFATLAWLGPPAMAARAAAGLGVSAWCVLAAGALYLLLVATGGFYDVVPLEVAYTAGGGVLAPSIAGAVAGSGK